jgi:ABC-2 type transport system ATP-binding protein
MADTVISVQNLSKRYNGTQAVDGISFEVQKGEIFGLLGPNGAGKTTTLEILETLRPLDSGTVEVLGMDVTKKAAKVRDNIGIQLQTADFYPNLNLIEVLELFASLYNSKINAMDLLERVDLVEKRKSYVTNLSGGQKQRFSIATTFVNQPDLVFLDEPTTGLDPQARRNLWDLILNIRDSGATVVLTTHYMEEAEELCDRVAIMDGGKILRLAPPDDLIDELLSKGFHRKKVTKEATLEDVFLDLTGKKLRD